MFVKPCLGLLLFLGSIFNCNGSVKISLTDKHGMLGAPVVPPTNDRLPPVNWFTQRLDHFQPTDGRTWKQRYQMRMTYYKEGGPVFLNIGGEGELGLQWMMGGAWVDYAKKYSALMLQLEHRYYGQSHPTRDLSVENLKYLSSEQALADLAYFVVAMNKQYGLPPNTKWVAFGGSYAGNLAAWVRLKYPHLIHASVSSSGPVLAKVDFTEYFDVVKDSLSTYSSKCVEAVEAANKELNNLLRTPVGQKTITKYFKLCDPINSKNQNDVIILLNILAVNFAGVVQNNRVNRAFKGNSMWDSDIDDICSFMVNETLGTPIVRYAYVNSLYNGFAPCLDINYDKMIKELRNTEWNETDRDRPWMYQTCTEFGYFATSERKEALFGEDFPVNFFIQQCRDIYGKEFTKELLDKEVERSNIMYGGMDLKESRVVYVHGSIDPWHALGITKTINPESPAIYINGTSHCANMYSELDTDLPALKAARKEISSLIGKWLQEP